MNKPTTQTSAPCSYCARVTKHDVLANDDVREDDEGSGAYSIITNSMLKCRACDTVSLRRIELSSELDEVRKHYWPPAVARHRPEWIWELPEAIFELLVEVYAALDANSPRLAAMGARTALDVMMTDKVGDGTFQSRLEKLHESGVLSKDGKSVLLAALDAGHAAIHRAHKASLTEVRDLFDIVENLLHSVYLTPIAAKRLRRSTPKRRKKS